MNKIDTLVIIMVILLLMVTLQTVFRVESMQDQLEQMQDIVELQQENAEAQFRLFSELQELCVDNRLRIDNIND